MNGMMEEWKGEVLSSWIEQVKHEHDQQKKKLEVLLSDMLLYR